jgi:Gly-Xaa carboxypeptidase
VALTFIAIVLTTAPDTKFYWKLSRSIFRYNHRNIIGSKDGGMSGAHTVNESA